MTERRAFFGLTPAELAEVLGGTGRARACWRAVRDGRAPLDAVELGERTVLRFRERLDATPPAVVGRSTASDETRKLLLRLPDGQSIEAVIIPNRNRTTVCVSTQAGCTRDCAFCVTATVDFARNLSAAEMVAQVHVANLEARAHSMPPLRNIVYMGMGEPLDNLDSVRASARLLTDHHGFAMPANRLTISTIGTSPDAIRAAADLPGYLAWSLHSVDDEQRRRLIPAAKHPLADLRQAFVDIMRSREEILFIEMVLIRDVNDSLADAEALRQFVEPLRPGIRINLLPLNPGRSGLAPTSAVKLEAYQQHLRDHAIFCAIRNPRGTDAAAACGQLAASSV
jgi:23S rRNA (adenine2503-C2)-methyltransferase